MDISWIEVFKAMFTWNRLIFFALVFTFLLWTQYQLNKSDD